MTGVFTRLTSSVREPVGVATRCAWPFSKPSNSGMTRPIALAAPDEVGTVFTAAALARRKSPLR